MDEPKLIEYLRVRNKYFYPIRQWGMPYGKIMGPCLLIGVVAVSMEAIHYISIHQMDNISSTVIMLITLLIFIYVPERIYHERYRIPRINYRKYPQIKSILHGLVNRDNGEKCSNDVPVLWINQTPYFLCSYVIRQSWWEMKSRVRITGWVLLDGHGHLIRSSELFMQAFLTLMYASTGSVNIQNRDITIQRKATDIHKFYLPRAIRFIHFMKWQFCKNGLGDDWTTLEGTLQILYKASEEILYIFADRENVRSSIGYSFGTEFFYEDALNNEQLRRAYYDYMVSTYGKKIPELLSNTERIKSSVNQKIIWVFKGFTRLAINTIMDSARLVMDLIREVELDGIPGRDDWNCYLKRLESAESMNRPIVQIGEFSEEYPVQRIKELFPDYEIGE